MRPVDRIILGLVILAVATAAFFAVRRKKRGGCSGNCSDCGGCGKNTPAPQKKADK